MNILLSALLFASAAVATEPDGVIEPPTGSICIAPVAETDDPRAHAPDDFSVRVDKGHWVRVPRKDSVRIAGLSLGGKHLVSIRENENVIESFWFRFETYETAELCLWYKPWYRTWSLWDSKRSGPWCRCAQTDEKDET